MIKKWTLICVFTKKKKGMGLRRDSKTITVTRPAHDAYSSYTSLCCSIRQKHDYLCYTCESSLKIRLRKWKCFVKGKYTMFFKSHDQLLGIKWIFGVHYVIIWAVKEWPTSLYSYWQVHISKYPGAGAQIWTMRCEKNKTSYWSCFFLIIFFFNINNLSSPGVEQI